MTKFAVVGASGFVGSAVVEALEAHGDVRRVRAPRLKSSEGDVIPTWAEEHPEDVAQLAWELRGVDVVVNAAGDPDASSRDSGRLMAANGALPGVVAAATAMNCRRLVHVSSAVVQGRAPLLDDTPADQGFSAYSTSKVIGEQAALRLGPVETVVYRPPSVHSPTRRVSQLTARLARSPLASVAGRGDTPTPQALIENVGAAVAFLASTTARPPSIVIHPWEGLTSAELLRILGGREPRHLPESLARLVTESLDRSGRYFPLVAANARRVEVMWFGQEQDESWLTQHGWTPPVGREGWARLAQHLARGMGDAP